MEAAFEIWIYRMLIGGLFIIVWFFFQKMIKSVDSLREAINELKITVRSDKTQCEERHLWITPRINRHSEEIKTLQEDIKVLQVEINHLKEK